MMVNDGEDDFRTNASMPCDKLGAKCRTEQEVGGNSHSMHTKSAIPSH